jgi:hypothetical protein
MSPVTTARLHASRTFPRSPSIAQFRAAGCSVVGGWPAGIGDQVLNLTGEDSVGSKGPVTAKLTGNRLNQ